MPYRAGSKRNTAPKRAYKGRGKSVRKGTVKRQAVKRTARATAKRMMESVIETEIMKSTGGAPSSTSLDGRPTGTIPNNKAVLAVMPDCYNFKLIGDDAGELSGKSCFIKSVETKLRLSFPRGNNMIYSPCAVYIYQIWVHEGYNLTQFTTPKVDEAVGTGLENHISNQFKEYFDTLSDRMSFPDPQIKKGFTVIKRLKVQVDRDSQVAQPQAGTRYQLSHKAGLADSYYYFKWNINQKQHYEKSTHLGNLAHAYVNKPAGQGYPAIVVYSPDFATAYETGNYPTHVSDANGGGSHPLSGKAFDRRIKFEQSSICKFMDA